MILSREGVVTNREKQIPHTLGCAVGCTPSGSSCLIAMMLLRLIFIYGREIGRGPHGLLRPRAGSRGTARHVSHHHCLSLASCRTIMGTVCTWAFSSWGFSWETESEDKQWYTGSFVRLLLPSLPPPFVLCFIEELGKNPWHGKVIQVIESQCGSELGSS